MIQYITAPPPPIISANDDLIYNFTTTWRGGAHSLVAAPRAPESLRDVERKWERREVEERGRERERVREGGGSFFSSSPKGSRISER